MSKEKNLVYVGAQKRNVINGRHCDVYESRDRYNYTCQIAGPAIDRLHEFEKLGMEPEEIENMITRQAKIMSDKLYAESENKLIAYINRNLTDSHLKLIGEKEELERRLENQRHTINACTNSIGNMRSEIDTLEKENSELRSMNQRQAENIAELQEEIEKSNFYINNLELENRGLKAKFDPGICLQQIISQQQERINELDRICGFQKDAIDERDREIGDLKEELAQREKTEMQLRSFTGLQSKTIKKLDETIGKLSGLREYVQDLERLAKMYGLTLYRVENETGGRYLFIDESKFRNHVYDGCVRVSNWDAKGVVCEIWVDLSSFDGMSDELFKITENNLRKELGLCKKWKV